MEILSYMGVRDCSCLANTALAILARLFADTTTNFAQGLRFNNVRIHILSGSVVISTLVIPDLAPSIINFRSVRLPRLLIPSMRLFYHSHVVAALARSILTPFGRF